MNSQKDIQNLVPESHRDLVEVVPRGFMRHAALGGLLLGMLLGAVLAAYVVPAWMVGTAVVILLIVHFVFKYRSDKLYDIRVRELAEQGLEWKEDE